MIESTPAPFDAFISYSHADVEHAQSLLRELRARDLSAWIDVEQIEPGDLFVKVRIRNAGLALHPAAGVAGSRELTVR